MSTRVIVYEMSWEAASSRATYRGSTSYGVEQWEDDDGYPSYDWESQGWDKCLDLVEQALTGERVEAGAIVYLDGSIQPIDDQEGLDFVGAIHSATYVFDGRWLEEPEGTTE